MAGKVFVNYRRGDDPGTTGRIYDRLEQEFGHDHVFMDVEGGLRGGDDFVDMLRAQVAQCDVLLAIIGPRWLEMADEAGRRRLDNPEDWVRVEIASALAAGAGKRVIPVLVGGAGIPRAEDLPDDLKLLARKQVLRMTLERFKSDAQGLVTQVSGALADLEAARRASTEAEKAAAAELERKRAEEERARADAAARAEAERARLSATAGMTPENLRKAEELANWEFVKARDDERDLRDHLARFAGGPTERYAKEGLETVLWGAISADNSLERLRAFVEEFPKGAHADAARKEIAAQEKAAHAAAAETEARRRETEAWGAVAAGTDKAAIEGFLKAWPQGQHAAAAKARLKELRGGGMTRRVVLGAGAGAGAAAVAGAGAYATIVPGMPVWRLVNDRSVRTFVGHGAGMISVAFAPDGKTALSGSTDDTLILWDVATGRELRSFTGHTIRAFSVAFAPDGKTALSGSMDKTLKLWDVATGRELRSFIGHTGGVLSVAFVPDGKTALSGSDDKTLKLWDLTG